MGGGIPASERLAGSTEKEVGLSMGGTQNSARVCQSPRCFEVSVVQNLNRIIASSDGREMKR